MALRILRKEESHEIVVVRNLQRKKQKKTSLRGVVRLLARIQWVFNYSRYFGRGEITGFSPSHAHAWKSKGDHDEDA